MDSRTKRPPLEKCDVKDLSKDTWNDFEEFFSKYNGVQAGCWCMYYHRVHQTPGKTVKEWTENNYRDKKELVMGEKSRGILIYSGGKAIGWCQYGTKEELPRIDNGRFYKKTDLFFREKTKWRITCFFVDSGYRRRGVAKTALSEVIKRIGECGGGIVEAYPVTHGKAVNIWFGTVSMFEKLGFRKVADLGHSNVLMQKDVQGIS